MDTNKILECERNQLQKIFNFQLPNYFKKIGLVFFIVAFSMLFLLKTIGISLDFVKLILRFVILICLLIISISKDKDEDELVKLLRSQSYVIAFITGVLYAVIQPIVNYFVNVSIKTEVKSISSLGDFQVLIFMLLVQLLIFWYLKKMR